MLVYRVIRIKVFLLLYKMIGTLQNDAKIMSLLSHYYIINIFIRFLYHF